MNRWPSVEVHIDARGQFVALGVGVIVGRCGSLSHVRDLPVPLLTYIGREWVVVPQSRGAVTLAVSQQHDDSFGTKLSEQLNAFFTISPTLGLVVVPDLTPFVQVLTWIGGDGSGTNRCGSDRRFALARLERHHSTLRVMDWDWDREREVWCTKGIVLADIGLYLFERVKCNGKWAAVIRNGASSWSLWSLERIVERQQAESPVRIQTQTVVTQCFVDENKLAILECSGDLWSVWRQGQTYRVRVIDLSESYSSASCCSVSQFEVTIPLPDSLWFSRGQLYVAGKCLDENKCLENVTTGQRIPVVPPCCDEILPLEQHRFAAVTYGRPSPVYDLPLGTQCTTHQKSVGTVCVHSKAVLRKGMMAYSDSPHRVEVSHIATGATIFTVHDTMMYVPSSPPTVEVHIDARSQFVALGVGVIVGRCGSRSHVRALTPPDLTHIGREWVVVPQSGGGINLTISQQYYDWFAHYDRHLPRNAFFTISPTLGLVSAPDLLLRGEVLAWVGRDGSETNRRRGEGPRFAVVAERNDGTLVIRDWNRDDWNTEEGEAIPLRLFERVKCNSKWIVGFDERSGVLTLRNLERLLVGSNQQNLLPVRIKMQRVVTLCFVDDNKLAVLEGTGDMWSMLSPMPCYRVTVVDLHKSYSSGSCCSVLQTGVKIPLPSSMWLSGRGHLYVCGTGSDRARCIENVTTGQMIPIVPSHGSHCDEILPLEQSRFAVVTYGCPSPVYDLTLGPRCMEESVGSVCVYSDAVVRQGIMVSAVSLRQVDVSHIATGVTIFSIHGTDDNHITIYGSSPKQSDLV